MRPLLPRAGAPDDRPDPAESYRDELRAYAYRLLGSLRQADRLAEETLARDGRRLDYSADPAALRPRLYALASRACLAALAEQPPRGLPTLDGPPGDLAGPPASVRPAAHWLEPFPDEWCPLPDAEGAPRYGARESIALPFVAALQALAPLARAALVLCDVLGWTPAAAAAALDGDLGDTERALAEGRADLARRYVPALGRREPPPDERLTVLLMQYLYPWETADGEGLLARLAPDVVWQLPPSPSWYQGRDAARRYLAAGPFGGAARGRWRLLPRRANGQLAFGVYERDDAREVYRAHSLQVVTFAGDLVAEIVAFAAPALFPSFQLLPEVVVQGRSPGVSTEC